MRQGVETFPGQRRKEKYELFRRFRYRIIENLYRAKFFALFDHQCFKCGVKEKPYVEIGRPPVLCMDHHIPMILGGHLVPGNLVALCRTCNEKKRDQPPEKFYSEAELERLKPILDREAEVFSFSFDWNSWEESRQDYLLRLGVDPDLVREVLFNRNHPEYIGMPSERFGLTVSIDLRDLSKPLKRKWTERKDFD